MTVSSHDNIEDDKRKNIVKNSTDKIIDDIKKITAYFDVMRFC